MAIRLSIARVRCSLLWRSARMHMHAVAQPHGDAGRCDGGVLHVVCMRGRARAGASARQGDRRHALRLLAPPRIQLPRGNRPVARPPAPFAPRGYSDHSHGYSRYSRVRPEVFRPPAPFATHSFQTLPTRARAQIGERARRTTEPCRPPRHARMHAADGPQRRAMRRSLMGTRASSRSTFRRLFAHGSTTSTTCATRSDAPWHCPPSVP